MCAGQGKILGISASLRNARRQLGDVSLVDDLKGLKDEEALHAYLTQEAQIHLQNFEEAGRRDEAPFDQLYRNLKKLKGDKGLSNSEVALAAALWSAHQIGSEIQHVSLCSYFHENYGKNNLDDLKQLILDADGLLISTPVYFGDRGSLAQTFVNFLRNDPELLEGIKGKLYGGCAVGAKRNGGQETTLIYQLMDMLNLGMLGVGNDSETTSQYGGTGHAGDVGMMPEDSYGLATAMGLGRRMARVSTMLSQSRNFDLNGKHRVSFWVLQDRDQQAVRFIQQMLQEHADLAIEAKIFDISEQRVVRCLACDVCPTHVGLDEEYRCIIKGNNDDMKTLHTDFMETDAIIPVALSAVDREGLVSNYQRFIERTRYLRRGDYVFSDVLTAPLILEEVGAAENLSIRMTTSTMRHHTVLSKPMVAYMHQGSTINHDSFHQEFRRFHEEARRIAVGRLQAYSSGVNHLKYEPVGYVLSSAKDREDQKLLKRIAMIEDRVTRAKSMASDRVTPRS